MRPIHFVVKQSKNMAVFKTHKRWPLGNGRYLDVVRNNTDDEVILAIGQNGPDSKIHRRIRIRLTIVEAMSIARFIGNISVLNSNAPFEDEDTEPA